MLHYAKRTMKETRTPKARKDAFGGANSLAPPEGLSCAFADPVALAPAVPLSPLVLPFIIYQLVYVEVGIALSPVESKRLVSRTILVGSVWPEVKFAVVMLTEVVMEDSEVVVLIVEVIGVEVL